MPPSVVELGDVEQFVEPSEVFSTDIDAPGGSIWRGPAGGVSFLGPPIVGEYGDCWTWQVLPSDLLYRSYLAGGREPRLAVQLVYERDQQWLADATLGARVGLLRYGSRNISRPEGWQFDLEGAAFPRLSLENLDLVSADFRYGFPLTYRRGSWEFKLAPYHLSSHLADEYLEANPSATRINFSRDVIVLGLANRPVPALRLYAEAGWAFHTDGGSEPWEFQFGAEYSPLDPFWSVGAPFFAINGRIRQEVDFGGNITVQTGLQLQGHSRHLFRVGFHYFQGMSNQYQFFRQHEEQFGLGLWYDF